MMLRCQAQCPHQEVCMIQQRRRFVSGAWAISWTICVVLLVFALTVPAQAASQPVQKAASMAQVAPSAKVTVRRAFAWAGPGRGFWVLGVLSGGGIVPGNGVRAGPQWGPSHT